MDLIGPCPVPDPAALWRELVEGGSWGACTDEDPWADRAEEFDERLRRRWDRPHPIRDAVLTRIPPGSTVLDIGAGTGAWAIALARRPTLVTALDASAAMRTVLARNLAEAGTGNVQLLPGRWPEVEVARHDFTLCSHALYGCADLRHFLTRMSEVTRRRCFLVVRAPVPGSLLPAAAMRLWGHPIDCPNAVLAHEILRGLGLQPEVLASPQPWEPRTSATLADALVRLREHFRLEAGSEHEEFLLELLRHGLRRTGDHYTWPVELRSVLLSWDVG